MVHRLAIRHDGGMLVAAGPTSMLSAAVDAGAEVFRVNPLPPPADIDLLIKHGFLWRPAMVTWLAELRDSEADFLSGLSPVARHDIRSACRHAAREYTNSLVEGLDEPALAEWLGLYARFMTTFKHPTNAALQQQAELVGNRASYVGYLLRRGDELVAGALATVDVVQQVLRVRFFAQAPEPGRPDLARASYTALAQYGREVGCRTMRLGNDPNLYGHLMSPRLHRFKQSLGFHPVPKDVVYPGEDESVLERYIEPRSLALPAVSFVHPNANVTEALVEARIGRTAVNIGTREVRHVAHDNGRVHGV